MQKINYKNEIGKVDFYRLDRRSNIFLSGPFLVFLRLFNPADRKQKFADDWIRTADLWCWKQPLDQLSHNHCLPLE